MSSPTHPATRTVTRLSIVLEQVEETYTSAPFPRARQVIETTGEELPACPLAKAEPRYVITRASERPADRSLAYAVKYYSAKGSRRGVLVLWTDSREYAEAFANGRRVYAQPSTVEVAS